MKSKMASIVMSIIIAVSLSIPIPQNVGVSSSSSSGTVGVPLLNISASDSQIIRQPSSSLSGTGGLANSPWPMFRQNLNHTGLSPYDTNTNPGKLKWSFMTGDWVYSSPTIGSDGTIYVGSHDHNLYAINPDGSEKWSFETGWNVISTPAIGLNGTIYIGSTDNNFYAINPDGTLKWSLPYGFNSSPAIDSNGTIYVGALGNGLCAINPDGTLKWSFAISAQSSPAIGPDDTIYVGSDYYKLNAINPDGTEKWHFNTLHQVLSSPAIGSDGTIFIGSTDDNLYAIYPNGTEKWNFTTGHNVESSPAIGSDNTIYVGSHDYNLYAINPDGSEKWSFTTGGVVESSPAIGSDGTIYIGSNDYKLYAINPDGTEKWNFITGHWVSSSPAIDSDGTIYVGSYDNNLYAIGTSNQPPIANAGYNQTVNEGNIGGFDASASYDPDGTIETYEWDFEGDSVYDYIETINSSPDGAFDGKTTHVYGDNGIFKVTLRITDDYGLNDTDTCNITVNNLAPEVDALLAVTINEFESVTLTGHATDPGSDDLTFTWNWGYTPWDDKTTIYYNDGIVPDPYPSPTINSRDIMENATCQFGDDGVFIVTLTVSDDDGGLTTVVTNITVQNVDPIVTIESAVMNAEIGLRVAGRKYNDVSMILYEEGSNIGSVSIERLPGSPNEQMAWIPYIIDMTKTYSATVTYEPVDPPYLGGNPVWIYVKFKNGSIQKIHHTFNVQQSKKRDSEHWNHIDPWEVDLNEELKGCPFEVKYHVSDPGSDDEILTFTYGSQTKNVTHLNDPPNPDPFPSPEINPVDITDVSTLIYEGAGTIILTVEDDDGGTASTTFDIV